MRTRRNSTLLHAFNLCGVFSLTCAEAVLTRVSGPSSCLLGHGGEVGDHSDCYTSMQLDLKPLEAANNKNVRDLQLKLVDYESAHLSASVIIELGLSVFSPVPDQSTFMSY